MRHEALALVLSAIVLVPAAVAAEDRHRPLYSIPTDPTEFGSLRLEPFEAFAPPAGEWTILLAGSYFNQWNGTWHTRRVHEDFGRRGAPIEDDEIGALEAAFPADDIYRVDIEGCRFDLLVARGFANGVAVQARVPWIQVGSPRWDGAAEAFHDLFPVVDHYVRDLFPRGQTFLYLRADGKSVVRRDDLARSGIGDVALSVGIPLRTAERSSQRVAFTVEVPTGREDSLHGSGGWDGGIRWFWSRRGRRNEYLVGAGFTHQNRDGSFLGFERSDTFHLTADVLRRLSRRTTLHLGSRVDSSPLAELTKMNLADPVVFYKLGVQLEAGGGQWLSIDLGEEIAPQMGVDTDFSVHIAWGFAPSRLRANGSSTMRDASR